MKKYTINVRQKGGDLITTEIQSNETEINFVQGFDWVIESLFIDGLPYWISGLRAKENLLIVGKATFADVNDKDYTPSGETRILNFENPILLLPGTNVIINQNDESESGGSQISIKDEIFCKIVVDEVSKELTVVETVSTNNLLNVEFDYLMSVSGGFIHLYKPIVTKDGSDVTENMKTFAVPTGELIFEQIYEDNPDLLPAQPFVVFKMTNGYMSKIALQPEKKVPFWLKFEVVNDPVST